MPGHQGKRKIVSPAVEVLDDSDRPLLVMSEEAVTRQKLRHRAVMVFLRNWDGEVYLHRRVVGKGNVWNVSASGRVRPGESRIDAARRRLWEELQVSSVAVREIDTLPLGPEAAHVRLSLFLTSPCSAVPRIPADSQRQGMFADREKLDALLAETPHLASPLLHLAADRLFRRDGKNDQSG